MEYWSVGVMRIVPKGLNDGSQARSAWECESMNPSRRARYEMEPLTYHFPERGSWTTNRARPLVTPFPTGRILRQRASRQ